MNHQEARNRHLDIAVEPDAGFQHSKPRHFLIGPKSRAMAGRSTSLHFDVCLWTPRLFLYRSLKSAWNCSHFVRENIILVILFEVSGQLLSYFASGVVPPIEQVLNDESIMIQIRYS
jgi:hypothetical protein